MSNIGGGKIEEFAKKTMKSLLDVVLTRQFNLTGQNGK